MRKKENTTAKQKSKEKATAGSKRKKPVKSNQCKIKITGAVAGIFGLSANIDDVISLDKKQAEEIVNANRAIYIK